jgi:hypothetical protein
VDRTIDVMTGQAPGEFTISTMGEIFMAAGPSLATDDTHRELAIEAATGKIWQAGCGDYVPATPGPTAAPVPSGEPIPEPTPAPPGLRVFLDLVGWDDHHAVWEASNLAWIKRWYGREEPPRAPLGSLDASLAPAEECTPGAVPTSTPTPRPTPTPQPTPTPAPTPTPEPTPSPTTTP